MSEIMSYVMKERDQCGLKTADDFTFLAFLSFQNDWLHQCQTSQTVHLCPCFRNRGTYLYNVGLMCIDEKTKVCLYGLLQKHKKKTSVKFDNHYNMQIETLRCLKSGLLYLLFDIVEKVFLWQTLRQPGQLHSIMELNSDRLAVLISNLSASDVSFLPKAQWPSAKTAVEVTSMSGYSTARPLGLDFLSIEQRWHKLYSYILIAVMDRTKTIISCGSLWCRKNIGPENITTLPFLV